jgi:hypothetical protein
MIHLVSEGRIKNKKHYMSFAEDVLNELFPREFTKREIIIGIKFSTLVNNGVFGQAGIADDVGNELLVEIAKIVTDPDIRPVSPIEIASTIAHELVHVKQYIRGELNACMSRWKGQKIPYGPRGALKIPYRRQPWEVEAFEKEVELLELLW